jgi:hypothetical protein
MGEWSRSGRHGSLLIFEDGFCCFAVLSKWAVALWCVYWKASHCFLHHCNFCIYWKASHVFPRLRLKCGICF